jgi:hypothetical protein
MSLYSAIGLCAFIFVCVALCISALVAQEARQESEHFDE